MHIINKGFIKDQRILILGKLEFNLLSKSISVNPYMIICSGAVEFEEIIEYLIAKQNNKLFNVLAVMFLLTVIHAILNYNIKKTK